MTPILDIPQGIIYLDSDFAKQISFTSDLFTNSSYLWGEKDRIIVSLIEAKKPGHGAFSAFMAACNYLNFKVVVPSPLRMMSILKHYGFKETLEDDENFGSVDVWVRDQ